MAIFLMAFLAVLTACSSSTTSPESSLTPSSSLTEAQDIAAKSVSAMAHVSSYKLGTDVVNTWKMIDEPDLNGVTEWNGTKFIDISRKQMKMDMSISDVFLGNDEPWSMEMYIIGGWEYCNTTSPGLYVVNPWDKTRLTGEAWAAESQIPYCIELLKTATQANLLGSEGIDGIDCYILAVTPSTGSIIDWVTSQEQPVGPQIGIMAGGAISVVRADAYQWGSVRLWVDKASYLPLNVETNAVFDGFIGGGINSSYPPTTGHKNSSFNGRMTFSAYNQPVSVQLPQEAPIAREYTPLWVWIAVGVGAVVILVVGGLVARRAARRRA